MGDDERYNNSDWISDIIRHVVDNYNNRKIVLWGKYIVSDIIKNILEEKYKIMICFYVDSDEMMQDGKDVLDPSYLDGKSTEFYVIVPLAYYESLKKKLVVYGYKKIKDYYYFCDCIIKHSDNYYEDSHGNKVIGNHKGLKFVFSGFNSIVEIEKGVKFSESSIYIHSYSKVIIGSNSRVLETEISIDIHSEIEIGRDCTLTKTIFSALKNCTIKIGDKCNIQIHSLVLMDFSFFITGYGNTIVCNEYISLNKNSILEIGYNSIISGLTQVLMGKNSNLYIGNKNHIGERAIFMVSNFTKIKIGNGCLLSKDIVFCSNDFHSIFDVKTKKNINSTKEICNKRKIDIGDHVWIGIRSTILYNTKIGNGSIVGAGSLVKSTFPNNCIAAGTPAKIVRRNVAWSNKDCSMDISDCGEKYIHLTEEWIEE
jgi:acetyltransferase-like isoleucine patch superfamily enzyme